MSRGFVVRGRSSRGHISWGLWLMLVVFHPMADLIFRREVWQGERIPPTGPAIIVANHISIADPVSFARGVWDAGRIPQFLAKNTLYRGVVGVILRSAGQIPVYRATDAAQDSLRAAVAALQRGEVVCIYPEGTVTRDPDWWPMVAKNGVARLALAVDAPVIPVGQWGPQLTHDYRTKKWSVFPRKDTICNVGDPIDLSAYRDRPVTAALLREVTDEIMVSVRDLLAEIRQERPPAHFHRDAETGADQ